jgi:hypothetical protein
MVSLAKLPQHLPFPPQNPWKQSELPEQLVRQLSFVPQAYGAQDPLLPGQWPWPSQLARIE